MRTRDMVYVDKTAMIYNLAHSNKYFFLSRPRRFGKSVLCDTFRCYFEGRKELFEGLKIMDLEKDWTKHPVIRLDMSGIDGSDRGLASRLNAMFSLYDEQYGITPPRRYVTATIATRSLRVRILCPIGCSLIRLIRKSLPSASEWMTKAKD